MFAIVEIAAQQFKVRANAQKPEVLIVPLLDAEPGTTVEFKNILAGGDESSPKIGAPYLSGCVKATVIDHIKDAKVLVFHKKRRKGYEKLNGHRQRYTRVQINSIEL
ncbi:MAG: 50S ribosomal protein L21 [Bacteroidetes bacterium]|nr:50S ribosomal protein L21 [Bacteroidota bacterium]MCZ2132230.1 50S ribosomal protein L21 [Bacteroidota bacterium]